MDRIPAREARQGRSVRTHKAEKLHHRGNGGKDVSSRGESATGQPEPYDKAIHLHGRGPGANMRTIAGGIQLLRSGGICIDTDSGLPLIRHAVRLYGHDHLRRDQAAER